MKRFWPTLIVLLEFIPLALWIKGVEHGFLPDWGPLAWTMVYVGYFFLMLAFFLGELYTIHLNPKRQGTVFLALLVFYNIRLLHGRMECLVPAVVLFLILEGIRLQNVWGEAGNVGLNLFFLVMNCLFSHDLYMTYL